MSTPEPELRPAIDNLIDRLVDGVLRPSELREAVGRLDATPDGWRRCAWPSSRPRAGPTRCATRRTSRPRPGSLASSARPRDPPSTALRKVPAAPRVGAGRALAAGLILAAFALGWVGHGWKTPGPVPESDSPRIAAAPAPPRVEPPASAEDESPPADFAEGPGAVAAADRMPEVREVARLRFGDGQAQAAEVPILAGRGIDERWLLEQPPAISERQQALWERQGYRLEQQTEPASRSPWPTAAAPPCPSTT